MPTKKKEMESALLKLLQTNSRTLIEYANAFHVVGFGKMLLTQHLGFDFE